MMPHVGIVYCVENTRIITTVNSAGLLVDIFHIRFNFFKRNSNTFDDDLHDNLPTEMDETV